MIRSLLAALLAAPALALAQQPYGERPEVRAFIQDLVQRHGFIEAELTFLFSRVRRAEPVLEAIERPAEKTRSWREYRAPFLEERRIADGVAFWRSHRASLARAERAYGVPAEYIVAIIGVETFYGRNTGRWRVVDALSTLAFDYPARANFFRAELESYLLFARESNLDVFAMRGSYAGAMGLPQFMPSSARRYAVDFDKSGAVDLRRSPSDAIGSVANYFKQHGWRKGAPVLLPARVSGDAWKPLVSGGFEPKVPVAKWQEAGVQVDKSGLEDSPAILVELDAGDVRLGFRNFYVITRYNRSAMYAASVNDLAQALRARAPKAAKPAAKPQSEGK
ncbi:MAG: rane-bound lytic murein transglycosylase [Betaproteobacteria bacterium]|nr:rane-bound lytic murein transglycosylase [Betaproteobacteria bacterium]